MVYVHIPFCRSFCTYCGFYSEVAPKCRRSEDALQQQVLIDKYSIALDAEIRARQDDIDRVFASNDVNTLYVGGGTPSVMPLHVFERLISSLGRSVFSEFTVEVNPEDIVEKGVDYVKGLVALGVNRISMGIQSFDDSILKWMNRRHTSGQAVKAYRILEEAGVENISVDLIFGLPQLSDSLWRETLDKVLHISSSGNPPKHISAYQLSVEEGSMLQKMIAKGMCSEASDELCKEQYDVLCEVLSAAGYHHYEISNFAIPGFEARHNSAYWRHVPYIGLGPGAHSYVDGSRHWNVENLTAYQEAGQSGDFSKVREGEILDKEQLMIEKIMLGLRTSTGVREEYLRESCSESDLDLAFGCGNLARLESGMVRIPENKFFISDNIISSII